jgi:hypothetical protein
MARNLPPPPDSGNRHLNNWLQILYERLGPGTVLTEDLGGTGVTSTAQYVASQQQATTPASGTAATKTLTGYTLLRPTDTLSGSSRVTTVLWGSAFADTTYDITVSERLNNGSVGAPFNKTVNGFDIELFNTDPTERRSASGTIDATGVHA